MIDSNLPTELVNYILFLAHPRLNIEIQRDIKKFKFNRFDMSPSVVFNNFFRIMDEMYGIAYA
jgi:hypothetical protein